MRRLGTLEFDFLGWWRTTSGHVEGDRLDDTVQRSPDGLPWLPGRTVKGLLRDAANQLQDFGALTKTDVDLAFGTQVDGLVTSDSALEGRFLIAPGALRFGSAEMSETWCDWAGQKGPEPEIDLERNAIKDALFDTRAMTAINSEGVAETGSLRRVEVAVPVRLSAPVWALEPLQGDAVMQMLEKAPGMIKVLGAGRNRGFGRVEVTFVAINLETETA